MVQTFLLDDKGGAGNQVNWVGDEVLGEDRSQV